MIALVAPGLIAALASATGALVHRRLRPSIAASVLATTTAVTALTVVWSLAILSMGFLAHLAWAAGLRAWCQALGVAHDAVPPAAGALALLVLTSMAVAAARAFRRNRPDAPDVGGELVVLPSHVPAAYAVPGRPGHIVVSVGMLKCLDDDERRVLLAHERAHLRHRHDRYVGVADVAVSAVPILRPLGTRVRFATERWADEAAAAEVGDRRLVARAIAKAALASSAQPASAMALGGLGVPARVHALVDGDTVQLRVGAATASAITTAVAIAGSSVQLHHLVTFTSRICVGI